MTTTSPEAPLNGKPAGNPSPTSGGSSPKPSWHRHRTLIVAAVIVVVLAVAVISDLPQHSSLSQQISDDSLVISEVRADAAQCVYAIKEAFGFYHDEQVGSLTSSERGELPRLLSDDQGACSFTNGNVYDLANIEPPSSVAGVDVGNVVSTVTLWVTSDALQAINAIIALTADPSSTKQLSQLRGAERLLAADRAKVGSEMAAADRALGGASLQGPGLPNLPLPGGAA